MSTGITTLAHDPEPAWDVARLFPAQGTWSESEYLSLTDDTNHFVELTDGRIEVLEMPTLIHQCILMFLLDALRGFTAPQKLGIVVPSVFRVKIREDKFREPDIVFALTRSSEKKGNRFFFGADLVMEIVSEGKKSRERDLIDKVHDYAEGGIPEYWIVDPQRMTITVLTLPEGADAYVEHGVFKPGDSATSKLLDGFAVDVQAVFDAAKE